LVFPGPQGLRRSARSVFVDSHLAWPLSSFRATLKLIPPPGLASVQDPCRLIEILPKRPLASLACPSACPNLRARFPWNLSKSHLEPCAQDSIVPPSGFGYPLGDASSASPRKPLSASHTPGLRLFRAFLDRMIELKFPSIPSALTLPFKTSPGLEAALQRLNPTSIAGFFLRPEFFPRIGKPLLS
jgi:hypothetical protein